MAAVTFEFHEEFYWTNMKQNLICAGTGDFYSGCKAAGA
jgi:hypothetical protein